MDNETGLPLKDAEIFFRPYEYLDMYFYSEITDDGKYRARITSDEVFRVEIKRNGVESQVGGRRLYCRTA